MKKQIFTLLATFVCLQLFAQTTYYWVGGSAASFTANSSWNTALDGSGTTRTAEATNDILIFDGTNIGGAAPLTGAVTATITSTTCGRIVLANNANITLQRAVSGTGTVTIAGEVGTDLLVPFGSTLTITSAVSDGNGNVTLGAGTTGEISGTVNVNGGGSRLQNTSSIGSLLFQNGAVANVNIAAASSYPFGSPSQTTPNSIYFTNGSTLVYQGGNSIFGNTGGSSPIVLQTGSTVIFDASSNAVTGSFNTRIFSNVIIRNNATVVCNSSFLNIDNLTINAGCTFNLFGTGVSPISGNIVNNGTFTPATGFTTSNLLLKAVGNQTVSGTGTFGPFSAVSVGTDANVTFNSGFQIGTASNTTSTINGRINLGNNIITGTGPISFRAAASVTSTGATGTVGGNTITLPNTVYSGSLNTANVSVGALVSGTGIPANSYIIGTNSGTSTFTISNSITATIGSVTISNNPATLSISNTGGVDAAIATTGTKTFSNGTNYIFNAATTNPFPSSTTNTAGNITSNAAITTNRSITVSGTLTINTGAVTIRATDTLRITSGTPISGTINNSQYIITATTGANTGVLRFDGITAATIFPVGNGTHYLPVTVTPTGASDICVGVFTGVTADATPTGTAFTATQKQTIVDAVWVINRPAGTGDITTVFNWTNGLEGSTFAGFTNGQIGISRYDGTMWTNAVATSANATSNTATATFSSSGAFSVGENGVLLPATIQNFKAVYGNNVVAISWQAFNEVNVANYVIERSTNGIHYKAINTLQANNAITYTTTDFTPVQGTNYYRLKVVDNNGAIAYSNTISVNNNASTSFSIYPNPAQQFIRIDGLNSNSTISIYNNSGKKIMDKKASNSIELINIQQFSVGTYSVVINNGISTSTKTFIKQ